MKAKRRLVGFYRVDENYSIEVEIKAMPDQYVYRDYEYTVVASCLALLSLQ